MCGNTWSFEVEFVVAWCRM